MSLTSYRTAPPRDRSEDRWQRSKGRQRPGLASARKRVVTGGGGGPAGAGVLWPLTPAFCPLRPFGPPDGWPDLATTRSPTLRRAVPWARCGFTAEFGMGAGGARTL